MAGKDPEYSNGDTLSDHELRERLVAMAKSVRRRAKLSVGYELVVVVTDPAGAWVGVNSSCDNELTREMLSSALLGEERIDERREVETTAEGTVDGQVKELPRG